MLLIRRPKRRRAVELIKYKEALKLALVESLKEGVGSWKSGCCDKHSFNTKMGVTRYNSTDRDYEYFWRRASRELVREGLAYFKDGKVVLHQGSREDGHNRYLDMLKSHRKMDTVREFEREIMDVWLKGPGVDFNSWMTNLIDLNQAIAVLSKMELDEYESRMEKPGVVVGGVK